MSELVKKITIEGESREIGVLFLNVVDKPEWLSETKPSYTALEIGALPITTEIPTKVSELLNDSEFIKRSDLGDVITVDETQFLLSTSAKYQLKMENGEISIVRYDPLTLSISGLSNVEIDSTISTKTITPTLTGTNKATATVTWSVSGGTLDKTSTTGSSTVFVSDITSPTSCTVTASATDGSSSANNKTTTLKFVPKIFWGKSTSAVTDDSFTIVDGILQEKSAVSNKSITLSEAGYLYFATPYSVGGMYLSNTTSKASLAGGWEKVGTFTKYTSSEKTYNIYRSELKAAGTYRIDVD